MRSRRGFTLIELLIAMGILAIVSVYLLETFTVNNRNYVALDQVVEAQQNMRAIADMLERDVRHAGFMVPQGGAVCGVDNTAAPDLLYVSDYEAVDPGDDIRSYGGPKIVGLGAVLGGDLSVSLSSLTVEPASPARPAYDTDGNGTNDSDFQPGGGAILLDRADPGRGVLCARVVSVNVGGKSVRITVVSGGLGPVGAVTPDPVLIPATEYRVDNQFVLRRNGLALARGVEDLQVAYLFDFDGDGAIAAGEIRGDDGGVAYVANAQSIEDLRELRINFVARTRAEDAKFDSGSFQARENRVPIAGNDGYRRRVYTSTILPRNLVNRMEAS